MVTIRTSAEENGRISGVYSVMPQPMLPHRSLIRVVAGCPSKKHRRGGFE
jgi:hypothetical protein